MGHGRGLGHVKCSPSNGESMVLSDVPSKMSAKKKTWSTHKIFHPKIVFSHISYSSFQIQTSSGKCCTK